MTALTKKQKSILENIISTTNAGNVAYHSESSLKSLADAGLVEMHPDMKDESGARAVRPTEQGIQLMSTPQAENTAAATPKVKPTFAIAAAIAMPSAKRGGRQASDTYPFDQLEVGQAFFVPATEDRPNPAKSIASTVTSANERYSEEIPGETRENRKGKIVPATRQLRKFESRALTDGAPFGAEYAGVAGAGVWRTL